MANKKSATDGAQNEENVEIPDDRITARIAAESELVELQRKQRDEDIIAAGHTVVDTSTPPSEPDPEPDPTPASIVEPEPTPEPEKETYETLKIDGVETQVEKSKVYETGKRALQKEIAADTRLAEAAEKMREADSLMEKLNKQSEELQQKLEKDVDNDLSSEEDIKSIVHAIKYGDDSDTEEAIKKLVNKPGAEKATSGLTKDEVQSMLAESREVQIYESALKTVKLPPDKGGFGDLFDGGLLENAWMYEEDRLFKEEPNLTYDERFRKAGESVRETFKLNPTTPKNTSNNGSNTNRKKELSSSLPGMSGNAPNVDQPAMPESEQDKHNRLLLETQQSRRG